MLRFTLIILLVFISLLTSSCDTYDDAQREFEQQAMQTPEGFTRTTANGEILSTDPDDWRISPMYQRLIEVSMPAFPNPTQNDRVLIEINILSIDAVRNVSAEVYQENFGQQYFRVLDTIEQSPLAQGIHTLQIEPVELSINNSYEDAIGLHRILIYDGQKNLITYGDVMVE